MKPDEGTFLIDWPLPHADCDLMVVDLIREIQRVEVKNFDVLPNHVKELPLRMVTVGLLIEGEAVKEREEDIKEESCSDSPDIRKINRNTK